MVKDPLVPVAKRVVEEPWHFARRLAGRHGRQAARPEGLLCVTEDACGARSRPASRQWRLRAAESWINGYRRVIKSGHLPTARGQTLVRAGTSLHGAPVSGVGIVQWCLQMRGQRLSCWVAGRPRWSLLRVWLLRWGWPLMRCG